MLDSKISKLFPPLTVISRVIYLPLESLIALVLTLLSSANSLIAIELRKQIESLEQKMSKSPNNMKDGGSHFLYHREQMIRFKLMQSGISQKKLAKHLKLTESYISKLITGERYNQDFEIFLRKFLQFDYCFM